MTSYGGKITLVLKMLRSLPPLYGGCYTTNNKNYNLRSNELDFALPKPNTNYLKKSFSYSGAALWNDCRSAQKIEQYQLVSLGLFSITWKNELVNRVIPFITFYTFFRISFIVCNIRKVLFFVH